MLIENGPTPEQMGLANKENNPELERKIEIASGELRSMKSQMEAVVRQEYELNAAQSPIDSTDSSKQREYEQWRRGLLDSRRANLQVKEDLQKRINAKQEEVDRLENMI